MPGKQLDKIAMFLRYEEVPISKLKISKSNNRIDVPDRKDRYILENSIKAVGVLEPIDVNENYEVISGQLRYLCAIDLSIPIVPVKVWKFKDEYSERIFSLLTDTARTPLSDRDKFNFVKSALENGKTVDEIAFDTGMSPTTIRAWYSWGKSPSIVAEIEEKFEDEESKKILESYYDTGIKKKESIDAVLKMPQFSNDPKKALNLIKNSMELPSRELNNLQIEYSYGLDIDLDKRMELIKNSKTKLFNLRIPEGIFSDVARCMAKEGIKDLHLLILDLLKKWVSEKSVA